MKKLMVFIALVSVFFVLPAFANAGDSIGVYCWQLDPYIDVICFDLETRGTGFAWDMSGWAHISGYYKDPLSGTAIYDNYAGRYLLQFDWASSLGVYFWQVAADIDTSTLNGEWIDDTGDFGDFLYLGIGPMSQDFNVEGIGPKSER